MHDHIVPLLFHDFLYYIPSLVEGVLHSAICVFSTWTTLMVLGGSTLSVSLLFIFNLSYLLLGYWFTETDGYDVTWTMPHCVLCLRLIGLAFDVADGQKPEVRTHIV